jgi:hypothetical protein
VLARNVRQLTELHAAHAVAARERADLLDVMPGLQKTWTGWSILAYNLDTLTIHTA